MEDSMPPEQPMQPPIWPPTWPPMPPWMQSPPQPPPPVLPEQPMQPPIWPQTWPPMPPRMQPAPPLLPPTPVSPQATMNAATEAAAAPAPATSSAGAVATGEPEAAAVAEGQEVKELHKIKTDGVAAAQRAHRDRPFFAHTQEALKETHLMKVKTESGNKNYPARVSGRAHLLRRADAGARPGSFPRLAVLSAYPQRAARSRRARPRGCILEGRSTTASVRRIGAATAAHAD